MRSSAARQQDIGNSIQLYIEPPMSRKDKKISKLQKSNRKLKTVVILLSFLLTIFVLGFITSMYFTTKFYQEIKQLKEENQSISDLYMMVSSELDMIKEKYIDLYNENESNIEQLEGVTLAVQPIMEINETLSEQNRQLIEQADMYKAAVEEYESRSELYDKYSYAIVRKNGSRTDLTYDQVRTVESLSEEKGIDTDLVFSIVMTESNGKEKASNPTSTARGYGQILASTGEFVYEKLLKKGNYDHSMAFNGDLNLEMMVTYLGYLEKKDGGRLYATIQGYRGEGGEILSDYIAKIDKYLQNKDKSVEQLAQK